MWMVSHPETPEEEVGSRDRPRLRRPMWIGVQVAAALAPDGAAAAPSCHTLLFGDSCVSQMFWHPEAMWIEAPLPPGPTGAAAVPDGPAPAAAAVEGLR